MHIRRALFLWPLLLAGAALVAGAVKADTSAQTPPAWLARYDAVGLDLGARDVSIRPGDDFHLYASGAWIQENPIPADRTSYSVAAQMREEIERQVLAIVEAPGGDRTARQVNDLYDSWMDEQAIQARGAEPARPYLDRIAAVRTRDDLLSLFAEAGFARPVAIDIIPDPADPTRYVAVAGQAGLGMPSRDYYLQAGEQYEAVRSAYRRYIVTLNQLAGLPDPEAQADAVFALEHAIAEAHWAPERSRDISQIYNPMSREQLDALAPQFVGPTLLGRLGLEQIDTVIVGETTAVTAIGALLEAAPLPSWKAWLAFHFLDRHAAYLPRGFDEARFEFRSRTLNGVPDQPARWRRGIQLVDTAMGEAVGRIYLERHFSTESRQAMDELIGDVRAALDERLRRLDWMDDPTRAEALAKLSAFEARIGGPDVFIDYAPLSIDRADLLGNVIRSNDFVWRRQIARLSGPVDRSLWAMTPQTVDAYYDPLTNQINFPAGVLQPPFFNPSYDAAVNYGNIGSLIGHEIGHGFDDQGRNFDDRGRIRDWWSPASAAQFAERARQLSAQYAEYEPLPGLKLNAELTVGENLGDLGGLEIAYDAYRRHVSRNGEPPVVNGLTGDQRFFLSYAQAWRSHMREERLRELVLSDPHSPPAYRVNGVVRNMDAWYRAFGVQPGDGLYLEPDQRVRIW